jgi:nucleoside-diphosphate-sugar epimerase
LKNILIIGGTGFIGYHLAKKCLKKNFKVTSVSKNRPKKIRFLKKVKYIICDINNKKILKKIDNNFDYVVNLGGYVDHKNKQETYRSHYLGLKKLTKIFIKKKIKKFIQIGSSMEYGRVKSPQKENFNCYPESIYAISKFLSTKHLITLYKKKKFPAVILRLYQVYGPNQDKNRLIPIIIDSCKNNKSFPCSSGVQLRDFLFVDDLIDAILRCLDKKVEGKIINIGSGKIIQVKKIINQIVDFYKAGKPLFGSIKLRNEEMLRVYPSLLSARKFLGWKSKVSFGKGILKTINFYNKNKVN